MTAATEPPPRIATLDIVRGVAVMGILAMNIVAFAMPFNAYMNPASFGMENQADFVSWLVSFIFIDGKMRGLFSLLFGASMLLVIERSQAKGEPAKSVHFRRMVWLLLFGLLHFYFIWFGDILSLYAMVGMIAWLFRGSSPRKLILSGAVLVAVQFLIFAGLAAATFQLSQAAAAPDAPAQAVSGWEDLQRQFGVLTGQPLMEKLALHRGAYSGLVEHRLIDQAATPFTSALMFGWETLAYMLFGMAALKTGFFKGEWSLARYRKIAVAGFAIGIPAYALLAWLLVRDGFTVPMVLGVVMAGTTPFRPVMVVAVAALIILLTRNGGALVNRIAAAGRAAFTNYLGTSIVMTPLFYGYGGGLYGHLGRAELWLVVIAMWALMLLWSKPWLDRNLYGPFE
ncbi:MAG TPA: DUF418 domain-containing protein, partial [Allosphingosinicella sp.]|nr:DUF418 domain-containing protein [Allosphingosinicella sp.]